MNRRALFVLVAMLAVLAASLSGAEEKPAGDPQKAVVQNKTDIRRILEAGQTTRALPAGVAVHVSASMTRRASETRRHGAGVQKTFKEIWEFTSDQVHRIVETPGENGGNSTLHRAESLPFDSGGIFNNLLDGRILTIGEDDKGERQQFVGTDYDIGHRSIKITVDGKSVLYVGESCVTAGYAENDARAFAALYEKLAMQARDAFEAKSVRDRRGK